MSKKKVALMSALPMEWAQSSAQRLGAQYVVTPNSKDRIRGVTGLDLCFIGASMVDDGRLQAVAEAVTPCFLGNGSGRTEYITVGIG